MDAVIDKADLPVLGAIFVIVVGLVVLVLSTSALLGFATHVFAWAYTGVW